MGHRRHRPLPLFAGGWALRHSRWLPARGTRRKSFHGGQDDQRGRRCHRQRPRDGMLPRHRGRCWQSRGKVATLVSRDMTSAFEHLWEETFRHAAKHSPYYRETLGGFAGLPKLADLPLVDKATVSQRNLDFLCVPRERIVELVTTSGTTGEPLLWMLTET